jgi:terminase small subunit / prophage DNA-packing protein
VQADKIELELAEKRGLLLPADQIEPKLRAAMVAAREMWRNEPARLAREVPGKTIKEMEDLLAQSYEAFLIKLSRWQDVQIVEDEEGDE